MCMFLVTASPFSPSPSAHSLHCDSIPSFISSSSNPQHFYLVEKWMSLGCGTRTHLVGIDAHVDVDCGSYKLCVVLLWGVGTIRLRVGDRA